jgi:hypothetical protein
MPAYVVNMKHSAESCPLFNDVVMNKFKDGMAKREESAKKHNINVITACAVLLEHLVFYVVEAPSQSAIEEYLKETGWASFNAAQIREVQFVEDVGKRYGVL